MLIFGMAKTVVAKNFYGAMLAFVKNHNGDKQNDNRCCGRHAKRI
jgi:hypothetical protein